MRMTEGSRPAATFDRFFDSEASESRVLEASLIAGTLGDCILRKSLPGSASRNRD